jgi:hypothetical protein
MTTSPQECLRQIQEAEDKVNKYEKEWNIWNNKYQTLLNDWNTINNKIVADDIILYNWLVSEISNNTKELDYSENCGTSGRCRSRCQELKNRYITPNGRSLGFSIKDREVMTVCNEYACCFDCYCRILTDSSANYFNNEKNKILEIIKTRVAKTNEMDILSRDMPQPEGFEIKCCLSEINCKNGKCIGNIQVCRLENTNKLGTIQTEGEKNNKDNVENIKRDINNILNRIISLSNIIYDDTNKLYEIIKQDNIKKIITDLQNLNSNLSNTIKTIDDTIKDINNKKKEAERLANLTNDNSAYKGNINNNLNLINNFISSINNYVLLINNNYSNFKKILDNIIKEDNNLILLNICMSENDNIINNLNNYILEFNNNIEKANKLNSISKNNLDTLLNLYNNCIYLKQNIEEEKKNLDKNNKSLEDIYKNFNEGESLNYSYAYSNYNKIKNNILDINKKINDTKILDRINNLNSIYISLKEKYNAGLIKQENEEKQKKLNNDISLLKLIEEENSPQNNISNKPMEISDKIINDNYQENKQTESSNYVIYIIIGIILIGFFIIKK